MRSVTDNQDVQPSSSADPITVSRRSFVQLSAVGASASLIAACSAAAPSDDAAARRPDWSAADIPPQHGRKVLVTGANGYPREGRSGLGYHGALAMARAGADIIIASRNRVRGEEALRRIRAAAPGAFVRFEALDLADLESVKSFGARMQASGEALDLLINNAGVMGRREREVSVDGFERVFATNALGHFALTALLLPLLRKAREPRVVWVSSLRAASGRLAFDDLQSARVYDYAAAYDNSKLAILMLAFEFNRRSKAAGWNVASLASHPGVARTNLIPDGPGMESAEGWRLRMLPFMFQAADQGALPTLYATTSPQAVGGAYYGPAGLREMRGAPGTVEAPGGARDPRRAAILWSTLERMSGVSCA